MSIIQIEGLTEVPKLEIAPEGEYLMKVAAVEETKSKEGDKDMFKVRIEFVEGVNEPIPADETYQDIYEYLIYNDPTLDALNKDDLKLIHMRMRSINRFQEALGLTISNEIDTTDWIGREAKASIGLTKEDPKFGIKNELSRWL